MNGGDQMNSQHCERLGRERESYLHHEQVYRDALGCAIGAEIVGACDHDGELQPTLPGRRNVTDF